MPPAPAPAALCALSVPCWSGPPPPPRPGSAARSPPGWRTCCRETPRTFPSNSGVLESVRVTALQSARPSRRTVSCCPPTTPCSASRTPVPGRVLPPHPPSSRGGAPLPLCSLGAGTPVQPPRMRSAASLLLLEQFGVNPRKCGGSPGSWRSCPRHSVALRAFPFLHPSLFLLCSLLFRTQQ